MAPYRDKNDKEAINGGNTNPADREKGESVRLRHIRDEETRLDILDIYQNAQSDYITSLNESWGIESPVKIPCLCLDRL